MSKMPTDRDIANWKPGDEPLGCKSLEEAAHLILTAEVDECDATIFVGDDDTPEDQDEEGCGEHFVDAARQLAADYLATHPADDGEPVSAEFLTSISDPRTRNIRLNNFGFVGPGITLIIQLDGLHRWQGELVQDEQHISVGVLKTRGEFRQLVVSLGIPLSDGDGKGA